MNILGITIVWLKVFSLNKNSGVEEKEAGKQTGMLHLVQRSQMLTLNVVKNVKFTAEDFTVPLSVDRITDYNIFCHNTSGNSHPVQPWWTSLSSLTDTREPWINKSVVKLLKYWFKISEVHSRIKRMTQCLGIPASHEKLRMFSCYTDTSLHSTLIVYLGDSFLPVGGQSIGGRVQAVI